MTDVTTSVHFLCDRYIVVTSPSTYPSVTISDLPSGQLNHSVTISVTGEAEERRAFAAQLREAARFIERWERASYQAADPEPVAEDIPF